MTSTDPVWSDALDAHPRVRAALANSPVETGDGAVPLFYRLGDLLRALAPPPSPFQLGTDPIDTFLVDLFGLYLDWPSWVANQLVETVDARLLVRERGAPYAFADLFGTASDCTDTRGDRSNVFYLFVVWPPARGAQMPTARVSLYRVQRMSGQGDDSDHGDHGDDGVGDTTRDLSVTALMAEIGVSSGGIDGEENDNEIDEEYFDEAQFVAGAELYDFAYGTLADLTGVLPRLAEVLAADALSPVSAPMHDTKDGDDVIDSDIDRRFPGGNRESVGDRYVGASAVRRALIPLVALSPHLAREVMAHTYHTPFEPSLAGARAVLMSPCQLALILGSIAATDAAKRLRVVGSGTAPRTLADASIAATASAAVPQGTRFLAGLPEGIRQRAAFATWKSVCIDAPDATTGRLPRADRLVDVADALGVILTDAQLRYPERLCPDLLDTAARVGIAASYGAAPATPRLAPSGHPLFSQPALALVRHENDGIWSAYDEVDKDAWTYACGIASDARLTADEALALLRTAAAQEEEEERELDPSLFEAMALAVEATAVSAEASGAPLVFEPTQRRRGDYGGTRNASGVQRPRTNIENLGTDAASRVAVLAPLVAQALSVGAVLDPDDIVYPQRLCARMALYRVLDDIR
nr:hypothetical protein [Pandoravirus aubagnensis]